MNRLFLWGMPGCGKSTIGPLLAEKTGLNFYDLDEVIEKSEKLSIDQIFRLKGEKEFRKIERDALRNLFREKERIILATGGGTPCFFDNAAFMNNTGITVYIEADPSILAKRLMKSKTKRPLLEDVQNLNATLDQTIRMRSTYYQQAKYHVKINNEYPEEIAEAIHLMLK